MNYKQEYDKIKKLKPRQRGFQFEKLINKICQDDGFLMSGSYKTADSEQQIDGAIEINSKVFLIEAKWENSETLAASKLYSFLGKINSKIEGTIGLFISHNILNDNFISAIRNGLRQNCIIIHGKDNILDIIERKVPLKDFIWYTFQQASTKNICFVNTSEYLSVPQKPLISTPTTRSTPTSTPTSTPIPTPTPKNWDDIYQYLIDTSTTIDFSLRLETLYNKKIELSKKTLNIFSVTKKDRLSQEKYLFLIQKCLNEEPADFEKYLIEKLKGPFWKEYVPLLSLDFIKCPKRISDKDKNEILNKAITHLETNFGTYDEENNASYLITFLFEKLNRDDLKRLANAYLNIYCDTSRKDSFPQKQTSNIIYDYLKKNRIPIIETVKITLIDQLKQIKNDEYFDYDDTSDKNRIKELSIKYFVKKFKKILTDTAEEIFSKEYDKL